MNNRPGRGKPRKLGGGAARVRSIWSFKGRYRTLHLTWFAFFLSFVVWFNFAPFAGVVGEEFNLSGAQLTTLALCNVALTVPARVFIGQLLDRLGPRRVYAGILIFSSIPCISFALATSYPMLVVSRLALSIVGAGFVVGIRMVAEWFPPREVGTAEGVYGGWGNFGSAAAALTLPTVAAVVGGPQGWRWAVASTGVIATLYGVFYLRAVTDTPDGRPYTKSRRAGALEVTSPAGVWGLAALTVPLTAIPGFIAWRIWLVGAIPASVMWLLIGASTVLMAWQLRLVFSVNRSALKNQYPAQDRYPFRSVGILSFCYFCTFGSELAIVSMLPTFFADTWGLGPALAGATASGFAFMNLVARPAGGLMSDLLGSRRRTLRTLLLGLSVGYGTMFLMGPGWPVVLAVAATMMCSAFVQSGEGAVYAIVPLVKKRVTGQISGIVGASGNVGAITFLTILLFAPAEMFFLAIGVTSILANVACRWLPEPRNGFAEELLEDTPEALAGAGLLEGGAQEVLELEGATIR
ncbi:MAG: NarK family nitrate/nitrite MFS transporter [Actinomycetota bacterium]